MTLTMSVDMPDSFSLELRSLLTGLLQRDVHKRLGCRGRGADEIKSHPFFRGIDWRVVFLQRLPPPLIPARGEVNAADAFDIGSFDDEDTKHIRLTEADQELYRNFPVVVSERWQHEIAETIFDYINHEADKAEMKRKNKHKLGYQEEEQSDCILHGYIKRLGGTFTATWLTRYVRLYPNRLELWSDSGKQPELIFMDQIEEVCNDYVQIKNEQCIVIKLYSHSKYVFTNSDEIGLKEWHVSLKAAHKESLDMMTTMAEKATKIYGTEIPLKHMGKRRQQLQLEANSAIANLEQKIIQKELQASSRSPEVPAAAAAVDKQQPPTKGLENVCPAPQAASRATPVGHSHGTQASGQAQRHHKGHHQHRTHHHRHHHHTKHASMAGSGWSSSAAGIGHHHHRHTSSARHLNRATHAVATQQPKSSPAEKTTTELGPGRQDEKVAQTDSAVFTGEPSSATSGDQDLQSQTNEAEPVAVGSVEKQRQKPEQNAAAAQEPAPGNDDRPQQVVQAEELPNRLSSTTTVEQSNSIDSSSSGRSGSCSTSSEASGEEAVLPEEDENEDDEAAKIADDAKRDSVKTEPSESAKVSLQVTSASLDGQQQQPESVSEQPSGSSKDMEAEQQRPRLALSLENISEQQEVLRDPSKRITSDNKQREQDLVAQYEKLNIIGARNSSSSIEEEAAS